MKTYLSFLLAFCVLTGISQNLFAGNDEITVILLRHAEKDLSPGVDSFDPELSSQGSQRAIKLIETIKKYRPEYIFSTVFKRTRATVTPLAENLHDDHRLQLQFYDTKGLKELAERIVLLKGRTIVVAGHNTTTPALANLLIKEEKYKPLKESEYNKIWIIKIKNNRVKDTVIEY